MEKINKLPTAFKGYGSGDDALEKITPTLNKIIDRLNLLDQPEKKRECDIKRVLERLKLEFDTVICDCGEPWKESDAADIVDEALKSFSQPSEKGGGEYRRKIPRVDFCGRE